MAVNRNKRSLALDLKQPDGKAVLRRLIATADVLLTNIRPAALARLGFGYEACQEINPRLVYAAATGFGQDGPWAARPAFDEVIQASSGFASAMGSDDEPAFVPSLVGGQDLRLDDRGRGVGGAGASRAHRQGTDGRSPDVRDHHRVQQHRNARRPRLRSPIGPAGYKRMKERRPVRTRDGWLTMLPYSGDNWCTFFETVGHPECIEQFAVRDAVARANNIDRIYDKMAEIAITRTTAEWEELLLRIDVPHAAFAKITEIAEQPHLKAVGMIATLDHPSEGKIRQARPPPVFRKPRRKSAACRPGSASIRARSCERRVLPRTTWRR